ncbi:MAG TPA: alpha/beta hydrolase [Beijerinckiaceae bacterium]|jgi:pimeloyl-ACP methyl ester carboxylesterase|nr:alpha/beta hydrolase [Beijerinckiaceae bacterium]
MPKTFTADRDRRYSGLAQIVQVCMLSAALGLAATASARADAKGSYVDLPNVKLWITDTGGEGVPVILLHPTTGTSEVWVNQVPAFAKAGFRVITIDKPGWGKSIVTEGQKPISLTEDLDLLVDRLKLPKFHLVGVANGGYVAVDYAAWRPERVRSLVVSSSGLGMSSDPEGDAFRKNAAIPGFDGMPAEVREMSPSYRGMHPDGVARWKEIEEHARQPGAAEPPLRTPNTIEKVASLKPPMLIIAGDVDLTTPTGAVRLWAKHLSHHYDFTIVPEAGHALAWEQPDVFNKDVIDFLRKH